MRSERFINLVSKLLWLYHNSSNNKKIVGNSRMAQQFLFYVWQAFNNTCLINE